MTLLKNNGYAKCLAAGNYTYRLGDLGEPVEPGNTNYTKLGVIRIDDISTGIVTYTLKWYFEGGCLTEASYTFGGVFWIEWEDGK